MIKAILKLIKVVFNIKGPYRIWLPNVFFLVLGTD
jgi:hypothetical protein